MNTNCLFRVFYTICEQYKFLMHSIYHQARITKVGFWLARSFFFPLSIFFFFFLTLLPNFGSNLFASAYCFLFLHFTIFPGLCVRKNSYDSLRDYIMSTTCVRISCKNWMFIMMARHFSPYLSLSNWLRLSWKYPQSEYSWLQSRLKRLLLYTFPARACSTSFFCYKHWFLGKSGCKFGLPYPYHNIR